MRKPGSADCREQGHSADGYLQSVVPPSRLRYPQPSGRRLIRRYRASTAGSPPSALRRTGFESPFGTAPGTWNVPEIGIKVLLDKSIALGRIRTADFTGLFHCALLPLSYRLHGRDSNPRIHNPSLNTWLSRLEYLRNTVQHAVGTAGQEVTSDTRAMSNIPQHTDAISALCVQQTAGYLVFAPLRSARGKRHWRLAPPAGTNPLSSFHHPHCLQLPYRRDHIQLLCHDLVYILIGKPALLCNIIFLALPQHNILLL